MEWREAAKSKGFKDSRIKTKYMHGNLCKSVGGIGLWLKLMVKIHLEPIASNN